jgi:hypothetical protein
MMDPRAREEQQWSMQSQCDVGFRKQAACSCQAECLMMDPRDREEQQWSMQSQFDLGFEKQAACSCQAECLMMDPRSRKKAAAEHAVWQHVWHAWHLCACLTCMASLCLFDMHGIFVLACLARTCL